MVSATLPVSAGLDEPTISETVEDRARFVTVDLEQLSRSSGGDTSLNADLVQREQILEGKVLPISASLGDEPGEFLVRRPRPDPGHHRNGSTAAVIWGGAPSASWLTKARLMPRLVRSTSPARLNASARAGLRGRGGVVSRFEVVTPSGVRLDSRRSGHLR